MKVYAKKQARKALNRTKDIVNKQPKLKSFAHRAIAPYIANRSKAAGQYEEWVMNNYPDSIILTRLKDKSDSFKLKPLISIITPTYNTDITFLKECIDSVRSQVYDNWELILVDDASTNQEVRDVILEYAKSDKRIKYTFNKKNMHISGASNIGLSNARGEYVSLLDHDDLLWPNALFEVVKAINDNPKIDFIYSDEDKITEDRRYHIAPFFKPDWNPEFLRSVNYITHFTTIRRSLLDEVKGFNSKYDGAQDWDLFLRVTNKTNNIYHIPTVLYSWRISDTSTAKDTSAKPYVKKAQNGTLLEDLNRRKLEGSVNTSKFARDYWAVHYNVKGSPTVSIVIPSKNQYKIIKRCIESIIEKTTYNNYEITLVDTGSDDKKVLRWYENYLRKQPKVKIIDWPEKPFSYVRSCNEGARQSKGEYLVMLNNDTEVLVPNWIELMLGYAQQKDIGAVGAKLFYPGEDLVQHAGVGVGLGGVAANILATKGDRGLSVQQHLYMHTIHNLSAVTAACLMINKSKFKEIGGFAEKYRITYNDVDLCLRLVEKGYRNVYMPEVSFIHYESISLGLPDAKKRDNKEFNAAQDMFKKEWRYYVEHDPALNPNIDKTKALLEIKSDYKYYE